MTERTIWPGDKVRLKATEEKGIVVCSWWDEGIQEWDCYIAFCKDYWSDYKPYVLRYAQTSLERIMH